MSSRVTLRQYKEWETGEETWIFIRSGGVQDLELEVEAEGYDDWIPKGGKDEATAGNQITIRAKLKTKDGKPVREKAKYIKFELSQVSQEPGVCLNWPPKATALGHIKDLKDLQFDDKKNSKLEINDPRKQTAVTPDGEYTEAQAVISCYDYGAWGTVRSCRRNGERNNYRWLSQGSPRPKRDSPPQAQGDFQNRRRLESVPRERCHGVADDNDNENSPQGDQHRGDGLTLYEEYRGFLVNGKHVCGNPHLKDVFIQNVLTDGRTMQGIKLFKDVSGLEVHSGLTKDELGEDRIINCNHNTAHRVDQHGIVLTYEGKIPFWAGGEAVAGPGHLVRLRRL